LIFFPAGARLLTPDWPQHKNIVSEFKINRVGWQKWYGNRVIVRREIPEGEPECFTGNSKWLFVLKLAKTLVNSASERSLRNSGNKFKSYLV